MWGLSTASSEQSLSRTASTWLPSRSTNKLAATERLILLSITLPSPEHLDAVTARAWGAQEAPQLVAAVEERASCTVTTTTPILVFGCDVDEQHPAPGPEHEAEPFPSTGECRTDPGKELKRPKRSSYSFARIRWKAMRPDQSLDILFSCAGELDSSHRLQLVKRNRFAPPCLLRAKLCTFVRASNPVKQIGHIPRVRIRFVERAREQRTGDSSRLQMQPLRDPLQLCGVLILECDVESLHATSLHAT